jgi:hypothetical protein
LSSEPVVVIAVTWYVFPVSTYFAMAATGARGGNARSATAKKA